MKNHDIHENKNVCPEFNGEKMHEHSLSKRKDIFIISCDFNTRHYVYLRLVEKSITRKISEVHNSGMR